MYRDCVKRIIFLNTSSFAVVMDIPIYDTEEDAESVFQGLFKLNEKFYSAQEIRESILGCFPAGKVPFEGLAYIATGPEYMDLSDEELCNKTQRTDISRENILEERLPEADSLPEGTGIGIYESSPFIVDKGPSDLDTLWGNFTLFEATDVGYIMMEKGQHRVGYKKTNVETGEKVVDIQI